MAPQQTVHLPPSLVIEIHASPLFGPRASSSLVYSPFMRDLRINMISPRPFEHPKADPNVTIGIWDPVETPDQPWTNLSDDRNLAAYLDRFRILSHQRHQRTLLHHATLHGDILLAHEILRWGARCEELDAYGGTPLMTGLQNLWFLKWMWARFPNVSITATPFSETSVISEVLKLLIRHHADVNVSSPIGTPLRVACGLNDWTLIELLLEHGADPKKALKGAQFDTTPLFQNDSASFARFASLVHSVGLSRPPRVCLCASGKPLSDCHAPGKTFPRPAHFLCVCQSGKLYGGCCAGRVDWMEQWAPDQGCIAIFSMHRMDLKVSAESPLHPKLLPGMSGEDHGRALAETIRTANKTTADAVLALTRQLAESGDIDPAFAFVVQQLGSLPTATRREQAKNVGRIARESWNAAVDAYIAQGTDSRPPKVVKIAAAVDADGGPLYKRCSFVMCARVEATPGSFRVCSSCKLTFYCDAACQRAAWKQHKKTCKTAPKQQLLPSHERVLEMYDAYMSRETLDSAGMAYNMSMPHNSPFNISAIRDVPDMFPWLK